jgi:hypothetical protein
MRVAAKNLQNYWRHSLLHVRKIFARMGWAVVATVMVSGCVSGIGSADGPASVVESLAITARKPAFEGTSFGAVGPYEYVAAVATVRTNPAHASNRGIVDLEAAAGPDGWVRYKTDVVILRPIDASRASRTLVVEIANRGNKLALARLADAATQYDTAAQAGNGWFMRQGHSLAWIGWQGDVPLGRQGQVVGTEFPVARAGGKPIVGEAVEEFIFDDHEKRSRAPLTYPVAEGSTARLDVRTTPDGAPTVLPASAWRFVGAAEVEIDRTATADGGAIYSLVYTAKDPRPMGLGLAAVRDLTLFLKSGTADESGAKNPLGDLHPDTAVLFGISQSGRFLRDFIWQDFNRAPEGARVFDAAMPIIAGSRKSYVNMRFGQPGRYSRQHEDHFFPGDQFPFTYATTTDPVTGKSDGIFARCAASNTCPKLMHLDSNLEFWQARASLLGVDGRGRSVPVPENVRFYLMGSTQHGPASRSVAGICKQPNNTAVQAPLVRAAFQQLVDWTGKGRPPADSRYPLSNANLAPLDAKAMGFPDLAPMGIEFPTRKNELAVVDPRTVPFAPDVALRYATLLPRTNSDGHDLAAVLMPDVAVPLATYSGWNVRRAGYAEGELCGLNGIQIPFAKDEAERKAKRDPRLSIVERYSTQSAYVEQVTAAANRLQAERFLLAEDAQRFIEAAKREPRVAHLSR